MLGFWDFGHLIVGHGERGVGHGESRGCGRLGGR